MMQTWLRMMKMMLTMSMMLMITMIVVLIVVVVEMVVWGGRNRPPEECPLDNPMDAPQGGGSRPAPGTPLR
jgi:uncharacterized membrane protein